MLDDPRIKRILKRYPKDEIICDVLMDVSKLGDSYLLLALRCTGEVSLQGPRELDGYAMAYLSRLLGVEFESDKFDFFLHSYVRQEFVPVFYQDPSVVARPSPEEPPEKLPIGPGLRWRSVRPEDGKEKWEAWEFTEVKDQIEGAS